jgi:ABC-2 type transport system ATP-binding protein
VAENLDFFVILKGAPRQNIEALCHRLELDVYWRDQAGHLDAGVFQRLSLACALLGDPELLIVDDLFRDIDLESRQLLLRELNRYSSGGGTCIWGFSDIRCCPLVHRVGWLENGALEVSDPEQAMRAWEQRLRQAEAVYGAGWL